MEILPEKRKGDAFWLTLLFGFGTTYWWVSILGDASFFAQTLAVTFMLLFVREVLIGKIWKAGIWLGLRHYHVPQPYSEHFFICVLCSKKINGRKNFKSFYLSLYHSSFS